MRPSKTGYNHDQIIREALRRELESTVPPPPDRIWPGIRAGLAPEKREPASAAPLTRVLSWRRLAAAAAVFFLFIGGGLALYRSGYLFPADLKSDALQSEMSDQGIAEMRSESGSEAWPLTLRGGFILVKAGEEESVKERPASAVDDYTVAVYARGEERLLWIRASSPSADPGELIAEVSRQLQVRIQIEDEFTNRGGFLEFQAGDYPGIAWQEDGRYQAFLILSGSPDLRSLLPTGSAGE